MTNEVGDKNSGFVIFCEARTGSYYLTSLLDSASDLTCHGEIFKKNKIELSKWHGRQMSDWTVSERNLNPEKFIESLRALNPKRPVGFKMFNTHLKWAPGALKYITNVNVKKIILVRNPLEMYSSGLLARETGKWVELKNTAENGGGDHKKTQARQVHFTADTFERFMVHHQEFLSRCKNLSKRRSSLVIDYSELHDPQKIEIALEFVGSKKTPSEVAAKTSKQWKAPVESRFANWDEFAAYLKSRSKSLQSYQNGKFIETNAIQI